MQSIEIDQLKTVIDQIEDTTIIMFDQSLVIKYLNQQAKQFLENYQPKEDSSYGGSLFKFQQFYSLEQFSKIVCINKVHESMLQREYNSQNIQLNSIRENKSKSHINFIKTSLFSNAKNFKQQQQQPNYSQNLSYKKQNSNFKPVVESKIQNEIQQSQYSKSQMDSVIMNKFNQSDKKQNIENYTHTYEQITLDKYIQEIIKKIKTEENIKMINSKQTEASYEKDTTCYVCVLQNYFFLGHTNTKNIFKTHTFKLIFTYSKKNGVSINLILKKAQTQQEKKQIPMSQSQLQQIQNKINNISSSSKYIGQEDQSLLQQKYLKQSKFSHSNKTPFMQVNQNQQNIRSQSKKSTFSSFKQKEIISNKTNTQINTNQDGEKDFTNIFNSISHEFGTYLNIITNLTQLSIEDEKVSQIIKDEYLYVINNNLQIMRSIMTDHRDFFSLHKNTLTMTIKNVNLIEELKKSVDLFKNHIEMKNLKLEFNYNPDIPKVFNTDIQKVKQVFINLICNAIKFTLQGQITINIQYYQPDIIISVQDTGIGMNNEEELNLTQFLQQTNFHQINFSEKISKNSAGCGIGLFVSNQISRMLSKEKDNHIQFNTNYGQGSTFKFIIQQIGQQEQFRFINFFESNIPRVKSESQILSSDTDYPEQKAMAFIEQSFIQKLQKSQRYLNLNKDKRMTKILMNFPGLKDNKILNNTELKEKQSVPLNIISSKQQIIESSKPSQFNLLQYTQKNVLNNDNMDKSQSMYNLESTLHGKNNNNNCLSLYGKQNQLNINTRFSLKVPSKPIFNSKSSFTQILNSNINQIQQSEIQISKDNQNKKQFIFQKSQNSGDKEKSQSKLSMILDRKRQKKKITKIYDNDQNSKISSNNENDSININQNDSNNEYEYNDKDIELDSQEENCLIKFPQQIYGKQIKKNRILIVDDEIFNIQSVKLILKSIGLDKFVSQAFNGQQALDIMKQQLQCPSYSNKEQGYVYKLIFMDINMPLLDGIEASKQIQQMYKSGEYPIMPNIIGYSAYYNGQTDCIDCGMVDFLQKPASKSEILSKVKDHFLYQNLYDDLSISSESQDSRNNLNSDQQINYLNYFKESDENIDNNGLEISFSQI